MITGNITSYNEANFNRLNDISYNKLEFFGQDSWKATKRLTVEFGLRLTHFTPWTDNEGFGYSIFNQSLYDPTCAPSPNFCGFEGHAKNNAVPLTGFPTRALYFQPRFGAAYDLFGTGKTVLRGGWGRFYYHSGQFTNGLDLAAGSAQANLSPTNGGTAGAPLALGTALYSPILCLPGIFRASTCRPHPRHLLRLIPRMTSNRTLTVGALRLLKRHLGKEFWKLPMLGTEAGTNSVSAVRAAILIWSLAGPSPATQRSPILRQRTQISTARCRDIRP